jgi:hypothetical protein
MDRAGGFDATAQGIFGATVFGFGAAGGGFKAIFAEILAAGQCSPSLALVLAALIIYILLRDGLKPQHAKFDVLVAGEINLTDPMGDVEPEFGHKGKASDPQRSPSDHHSSSRAARLDSGRFIGVWRRRSGASCR